MRVLAFLLLLCAIAGSTGCATTLHVIGATDADVYVANPPGASDLVLIGRTSGIASFSLDYALPRSLERQKVLVRVVTTRGAWEQYVFTDRDVTVLYPPEGTPFDELKPVAIQPSKPGGPPKAPAAAPRPKPVERAPVEPSATVTPD